MYDKLLYAKPQMVPIDVIKRKVSEATNIEMRFIILPDRSPLARKREYVTARQISMTLSKKYTSGSLSFIGMNHGGRDHATVLHATKTIDNLLFTNEIEVINDFNKAEELVRKWRREHYERHVTLSPKKKCELIKHWIKCRIPLHIRERKLLEYGNLCPTCGQIRILK